MSANKITQEPAFFLMGTNIYVVDGEPLLFKEYLKRLYEVKCIFEGKSISVDGFFQFQATLMPQGLCIAFAF